MLQLQRDKLKEMIAAASPEKIVLYNMMMDSTKFRCQPDRLPLASTELLMQHAVLNWFDPASGNGVSGREKMLHPAVVSKTGTLTYKR